MGKVWPFSYKSRAAAASLRIREAKDGTYDLAQLTSEGKYAVGYYAYTANDLLNIAASIKEYVNRTKLAKEGK